jgi:DNA-binding MarR family transcriptional regulator
LPTMYEWCLMHARADRAMRTLVSERLAKQNLSIMEWLALNVVKAGPKEGVSMSQIADILDVTLPQVSALVNSLIKLNLVKQRVLVSDRRGRQVTPTLRGKRHLQKLENELSQALKLWSQEIPKNNLSAYIKTVTSFSEKA